jgi:CRP-like cAMP-binding protein
MAQPLTVVQNRILASMAPDSFDRLRPYLHQVVLKRRAILQEHNHPIQHVYLIERGVASVIARTQRDGPVEVAIVGRLGFVGVAAVLGTMRSPNRCLMEVPGEAFSVASPDLQHAMEDTPTVRQHLLNYVHALLIQHTQTALCNVRHGLEERLCRWPLLASDRLDERSIPPTHDQLSMILGVRRASVTTTLSDLEDLGAVAKGRGAVEIADRAVRQKKACECYRIIASEYQHIAHSGSYEHVFHGSPLVALGPGPPKSKFSAAARFDRE